jgi:probable addiction module antidote protein
MKTQSTYAASVTHEEWIANTLRSDPEFAVEYLKQAMAGMNEPDGRGAALLALRQIAESCGGLAKIAADSGVQRESLYRALSPKGNPTLNTLLAVLKSVGMRLSVEPEDKAHA